MKLKIRIKGSCPPFEKFEVIDQDTGLKLDHIRNFELSCAMGELPQARFEIVVPEIDLEFEGDAEASGLEDFMRTKKERKYEQEETPSQEGQ